MIDELWPGGPRFKECAGVLRLGADSVLLAHFAKNTGVKKRKRAVDLGCGSGIISILLAWDDPDLHIDGIEIQRRAAQLAVENAELSGLSHRIRIIESDLRDHREFLHAGDYDFTVSNPPYYAKGGGKRASGEELAAARGEEHCTLADVCRAAGYLTRNGGSFFLIHRPERLVELFRVLASSGFEPKRIRFVQHKASSPPSLVLVESRRNGRPALSAEPPLILVNDDGSDTDEARAIYRL